MIFPFIICSIYMEYEVQKLGVAKQLNLKFSNIHEVFHFMRIKKEQKYLMLRVYKEFKGSRHLQYCKYVKSG